MSDPVPTRVAQSLLFTVWTLALVTARVAWTGEPSFLFLVTNLALAWGALAAAMLGLALVRDGSRWAAVLPLIAFVAMFPNAPYLVTDLVHLRPRASVPMWVDGTMLFAAASAGMVIGTGSLDLAFEAVRTAWGRGAAWVSVAMLVPMAGLGIAIGRFLRWNSWDLLTSPIAVLRDVEARLLSGQELAHTLAYAAVHAGLIAVAWLCFRRPATEAPRPA